MIKHAMPTAASLPKFHANRSRPLSVTLLALGVLSIAVISLLRFSQAIEQWEFLAEVLPISPLYLAASGLIWGLVSLTLVWSLWRGLAWSPGFTRVAALLYALYPWVEKLWLAGEAVPANWLFLLGIQLLLLGLLFWLLTWRKVKIFFGEMHE